MKIVTLIFFLLIHLVSIAQSEPSENDLKEMLQGTRWTLVKNNVSGTTQIRKGLIISAVEFYRDSVVIIIEKARLTGKWREKILAFDVAEGKGVGSYLIAQIGLTSIFLQDLNRNGPRIPYSHVSKD
jgi:hypothetical protein